jgi:hypothetical protein
MQQIGPNLETDQQRLDAFERGMLESGLPLVHMPVEHLFTPGLYRRTITMPPDSALTSKIHKTEHPYAVLKGRVLVWVPGGESVTLEAGYQGVTLPGTRRALYVPPDSEPCVWATFHTLSSQEEHMRQNGASQDELLAVIEDRIIEPHNPEVHREYLEALQKAGLPGPNDGQRTLT